MWVVFALLSAVCAALVTILAKIGLENVNSTLAVAVRTVVVLVMAWGMVLISGAQSGLAELTRRSWLFLVLSGVATGLSWLFYFKALQLGEASKVVPVDKSSVVIAMILAVVILKESADVKSVIGGLLITAGTFVLILK
jgi:transporter family protein